MAKTVEYDLKLPYTIEIFRDETDDTSGWVARVVELPGCMTQGDSFAELAEMFDDALHAWIETALTDGDPILVEVSGRGGTGGQPSWSSGLR